MFNPFFTSMMLAMEAQRVIELRFVRLAKGGREGRAEMHSMVSEKMWAAFEATGTVMVGGTSEQAISRYARQRLTPLQ